METVPIDNFLNTFLCYANSLSIVMPNIKVKFSCYLLQYLEYFCSFIIFFLLFKLSIESLNLLGSHIFCQHSYLIFIVNVANMTNFFHWLIFFFFLGNQHIGQTEREDMYVRFIGFCSFILWICPTSGTWAICVRQWCSVKSL